MNHTKGKLKADGSLIKNQNGKMVAGTTMIADTEGGQSSHEANARRLVACWNALDGVPTEWLEKYADAGLKNIVQQNTDLIRKEEELIEKLITTEEDNAALKAEVERLRQAAKLLSDYMHDPVVCYTPLPDRVWVALEGLREEIGNGKQEKKP